MIKAVIFDFDGLMVDTEIISFHIYEDILKRYGITYSIKEYSDNYSGHTELENIQNLIHSYKLDMSVADCFNLELKIEKEQFGKGVNLKKGLRELLEYLKTNNYLIAIATSSTKERCMDILKKHNIEDYFDEYVFAEDISYCKPNPEVYLKALEKLNVSSQEAIVLEDAASGILAATAAGIKTICIPDMKKPKEDILAKAMCVCKSLDQVIEILKNLEN